MLLQRNEKESIIENLYDSSNILKSVYDSSKNTLEINFRAGTVYKYFDVSPTDYTRFEIADSQGVVFNTHIKKYNFEKLGNYDAKLVLESITNIKSEGEAALDKFKLDNLTTVLKQCIMCVEEEIKDKEKITKELLVLKNLLVDYLG